MKTSLTSSIAIAMAAAGLLTAGCGADAPTERGEGVAPERTTTARDGDATDARERAVKFAECMRGEGVRDFPDPNAQNDFEYGVSVGPLVWARAVAACKALQPPGTLSVDRTPEQQQEGLRLARCMRENGVEDFPDPIDGEPLIDTNRIPSANAEGGMTILNAAIDRCRQPLAGAVEDR